MSISRGALVLTVAVMGAFGAATFAAGPTGIDGGATATERADRGETTQLSPPPAPPQPVAAVYAVTLDVEWSAVTHPTTVPPNSHISPPVVVTHGEPGDLFAIGTPASPGVEAMAERGSTSTLSSELAADGTVSSVQVGSSLFGPGRQRYTVSLARSSAELVSLVTMLAPSPDWFVGVGDVDLFVDGAWVDELTLDLGNYDAGTDSAPGFVHSNDDTQPAQVISGPRDVPFAQAAGEGRFGTVTFTRTG